MINLADGFIKSILLGAPAVSAAFALASAAHANDSDRGSLSWADALNAQVTDEYSAAEYRAFDFWIGEWESNSRPRQDTEFYHDDEGSWTSQRVFPILGGKAIVELTWPRENADKASQRGFSIRYYDPAKKRWAMAQYWPNQNNTAWAVIDQMIGDEHHGRLSTYSIQRRPKPDGSLGVEHRRYNFTDIRPGVSFRWDGSNTKDAGETWNTWAINEKHYVRDLDPFGAAGTPFPDVHSELLCPKAPHGAFDLLQGIWEGNTTDAAGTSEPARLSAGIMFDGCGVGAVLENGDTRTFMTFAYAKMFERWINFRLSDQPGMPHRYFVSEIAGEGAAFEQVNELVIEDEFTHFVTRKKFETYVPLQRTIWEKMNEDKVVLREEARESQSSEWRLIRRIDLQRKQ